MPSARPLLPSWPVPAESADSFLGEEATSGTLGRPPARSPGWASRSPRAARPNSVALAAAGTQPVVDKYLGWRGMRFKRRKSDGVRGGLLPLLTVQEDAGTQNCGGQAGESHSPFSRLQVLWHRRPRGGSDLLGGIVRPAVGGEVVTPPNPGGLGSSLP